jgi:aminoglycoside 3-N-acetyltransferase
LTRSRLVADLDRLGVHEGGITMVHTRMSALGWVVGGSETIVRSLLDVLGAHGTLVALAAWDDHPYTLLDAPEEQRQAYLAEPPVFDLATAEADRDHGRIPERIRTWPGARRSSHPEASMVALGGRAAWLTDAHPQQDAFGPDSPLARLVIGDGQVLMLGAPLQTITLLHHAEAIARVDHKRLATFTVPIALDGEIVSRRFTDIDTTDGALNYESLALADDAFAVIAREAVAVGIGQRGRVGQAECHLFPARGLTTFAVSWLQEHFR